MSRLNWESLHGVTLEGGYELGEISAADDERASFRVRVLGDAHCKAVAQFFSAKSAVAQEQLALWARAKHLNHPNLACPIDSGVYQVDGHDLIYVITRVPDERLDRIIAERPLEQVEARELLQVLRTALRRLHGEGLVHGSVSPEHVFAFGETIQLSTLPVRSINSAIPLEQDPPRYLAPESAKRTPATQPVSGVTGDSEAAPPVLREPPESTGTNVTPSADVWCLGATLFEVLTQRRYSAELSEQSQSLPDPIRGFITRSLDPNPANRPALDAPFVAPSKPAPAPAPPRVAVPVVAQPSRIEPRRTVEPAKEALNNASRRRIWIYSVAGLAAVLLLIWAARPRHFSKRAASTSAAVAHTATAWPTRTLGDTTNSDAARRSVPSHPVNTATAPADPAVWRVVLYTFARQQDAENRAHELNERHADLEAQVFSPQGRIKMYLVTSGGRMTREEALKTRSRALQMGMPRDTYIQNYKD